MSAVDWQAMAAILGVAFMVAMAGWIVLDAAAADLQTRLDQALAAPPDADLQRRLEDALSYGDEADDLILRMRDEIIALRQWAPGPAVIGSDTPIGDGVVVDMFRAPSETWGL